MAIWTWYYGTRFHGYQFQPGFNTIQGALFQAFRQAGLSRRHVASARTDRGVHARMQVLSLRVPVDEDVRRLPEKLRQYCPDDIGIAGVVAAPPKFNAAWSASGKEYRYRLGWQLSAAWRGAAWEVSFEPQHLAESLALFIRVSDFAAFVESRPRRREVRAASLHACGEQLWEIRLTGDKFGRRQVRRMVGAAVAYSRGALEPSALRSRLEGNSAPLPYVAPPQGLVLWDVAYPESLRPRFDAEATAMLPPEPPFT